MGHVVFEPEYYDTIASFVADRVGMPDASYFGRYTCIGFAQEDTLVSGVVYCDYNRHNVFMHLATDVPLSRQLIYAGFDYPFNVMGVDRTSVWVEASNAKSMSLVLKLGYETEATLKGAARDGGDVNVLVMWKKNCRWLKLGERYGQER